MTPVLCPSLGGSVGRGVQGPGAELCRFRNEVSEVPRGQVSGLGSDSGREEQVFRTSALTVMFQSGCGAPDTPSARPAEAVLPGRVPRTASGGSRALGDRSLSGT